MDRGIPAGLASKTDAADAAAIIDGHLLGGQPVERLKVPGDVW